MRFRFGRGAAALMVGTVLLACSSAGGGSSAGSTPAPGGKVELTFWSWVTGLDQVVAKWNAAHPDVHVTVSNQAQGDALVTKLLTAAKAGNPPDLMQAEYQVLPTLVSNDVVANIAGQVGSAKGRFAAGVWNEVTLGTGAVYALPQDSGPMMLYYRADLFNQLGLQVPKTWDEFAQTARTVRARMPKSYLTTFSSADAGWFAGLSQQAGAKWWSASGTTWKVAINDAATRKVADYWNGLVSEGAIDKQPMYTPAWNQALNDGTLLAWPSAVWGPGVLAGNAASTQGKWSMAPLPQWSAGAQRTGSWGGSSTAVAAKSKHQAEAARFALWLNTDAQATMDLVTLGGVYPADRAAQSGPALQKPPAFFAQQTDFYAQSKKIADTAAGFTWGPDVNVAYSAYNDAFGKALTGGTPFSAALDQMQQTTVADMRKSGFKVSG
jgi:multiple sugar transport system substrate-binding protein